MEGAVLQSPEQTKRLDLSDSGLSTEQDSSKIMAIALENLKSIVTSSGGQTASSKSTCQDLSTCLRTEVARHRTGGRMPEKSLHLLEQCVGDKKLVERLEKALGKDADIGLLLSALLRATRDEWLAHAIIQSPSKETRAILLPQILMAYHITDDRLFQAAHAVVQWSLEEWTDLGDGQFAISLSQGSETFVEQDEHIKIPCRIFMHESFTIRLADDGKMLAFVDGAPDVHGSLTGGKEHSIASISQILIRDSDKCEAGYWVVLKGDLNLPPLLKKMLEATGVRMEPEFHPDKLKKLFEPSLLPE